jgi:DNA-binding NarL/FixJ family response regulator
MQSPVLLIALRLGSLPGVCLWLPSASGDFLVSAIRLLLADDNPEVLETLTDLLQPAYDIAGAFSDGTSLLQQIGAINPDLIILDISLGDMTGFEVARRLKMSGSPVKIIFLTVHENIDFIRAAFDLNASGYVFKSRIGSDLVDAINRACEGGHFSSAELPLAQ